MEIAFLGWGSLVWKQRELRAKGDWQNDGPSLPIEFMRLSSGGRITLVLYPGAEEIQTLWIKADFEDLNAAIENLRDRESTLTGWIGFVTLPDCTSSCQAEPGTLERIQQWAEKKGLDAVVLTDLPENPDKFKKETGMELNDDNIIKYLKSLKNETLEKAREYVKKTPEQINTKLRKRIREELGWE
ncbi:MAG: hypothetical protein KAW47_07835 [Thermoplasmatales archaeon]|nr:hypothetical protein [Thermoplasmatales archaeon]